MSVRTLGIFAQVDAGKTTLSEAILYTSGCLRRLGRVDHGDAFLDTHSIERARGITVFSKQARFRAEGQEFVLLDTPGHVDFSPEAERVMGVLDCALLLISGTDGVQAHTETLWKLLRHYHIPTFVFFNKMDLPGAEKERLLADAQLRLSPACVLRDDWDGIALCGDDLLEEFIETEQICDDSLAKAVAEERCFPCFFGSALKTEGVGELLSALSHLTRSGEWKAEFAARVYKISRDAQGNRLTHLRVTGGSLRVRTLLRCGETEEKVTQIRLYSGENYQAVEEVRAGQVCAVLGMSQTAAGDILGGERDKTPPVLIPVMTYRIALPAGVDTRTALLKLRQLEEEEPQLRIVWEERLREIHAQLMGQVQLEILKSLIAQRFEWDVEIDSGHVTYRETIADTVEGVGHFEPLRHYAEVHLIMEPLPRGSGLVFDSVCSEDVLDRNWQRLIMGHLSEKRHLGVLTGAPVTDMKITLVAGRAHIKHTEGGDFRQATYRAVRQGLMQAESVLLEPWYHFALSVPAAQIGRAINDIRAMSGEFGSPADDGENMCIEGRAPVSEMQNYMAEVVAYTRGKGKLLCSLEGYAPCHNAQAVIARTQYQPEADLENSPDSVFCSHGAGVTVKWNEVFRHMHIESVLQKREGESPRLRHPIDLDEKALMAIMEREFGPDKTVLHRPPAPVQSEGISLPPPKKEYLIVDGYNMVFAWDGLRDRAREDLPGAREQLLHLLSNYCGCRPCELVVVFDSYRVKGGIGSKSRHHNLRVVYTKENESADLYIESLLLEIGKNYRIRVATSDGMIQLSAVRSGVLRISAQELLREIESADVEISKYIKALQEESRRGNRASHPLQKLEEFK